MMADFNVRFKSPVAFKPVFGEMQTAHDIAPYEGDYEVSPTTEPQVLSTANRLLNKNIVINPIPGQYGLVTYDQNRTIKIT